MKRIFVKNFATTTNTIRLCCLIALGLVSGCAHYVPHPLVPQKSLAAFQDRSLSAPGLRAFFAKNHVSMPLVGDAWDMKALTLAAFYYEPSLAEARARLLFAQAAESTAAERPNPSVAFTPGYDNGVPNAPVPWILPVTADWTIETAGKRGDRIAAARHLSAASRWELVGKVWAVRSRLRTALLDLYAARQAEELLGREEAVQQRVVKLTEGQVDAGMQPGYLLTEAYAALDTTTLSRQKAIGAAEQAQIRLAGVIGIPPHALEKIKLSFAAFKHLPKTNASSRMRRQALLGRADLRAALERYAASQSELKLQIARQWPDLHLGPGYAWNSQFSRDSAWQLGLSLPIPVLNLNQGPIAEAKAKRRLAAAHFLTVQADALEQVNSALVQYRSALAVLKTTDGLLANLRQKLDSVRAQVKAGELQPLNLVDAKVAVAAGVRNRLQARIKAQQALGQLEDAVQSPLTLPPATLRAAEDGTTNQEKP